MNRKLAITSLVSIMTVVTMLGVNNYQEHRKPTQQVVTQEVQTPQQVPQEKRAEDETSRGGAKRPDVSQESQTDGRYKLRVQVTAYTPFEPGQTSGTGLAYDGRPAIPYHTLAVDPRVIPLGSKVYIPGLGWFLAHDTGNAIRGNIIDACLETHNEAVGWGRRTLEITVIPPKQKYKMAW